MKPTGKQVALGSTAVLALAGALVVHWEGFRADPYKDVTGVLTVCYGHAHAVEGRTYTKAECDALMQGDLAEADATVRRCIPSPMPAPVEAALVDFAYNEGPGVKGVKDGLCVLKNGRKPAIRVRAEAGDWRGVCDGLLAWRYAGGKVSPGLLNRRSAERNLCLEGL